MVLVRLPGLKNEKLSSSRVAVGLWEREMLDGYLVKAFGAVDELTAASMARETYT